MGVLDKIKNILNGTNKNDSQVLLDAVFSEITVIDNGVYSTKYEKLESFKRIVTLTDKEKVVFMTHCIIENYKEKNKKNADYRFSFIINDVIKNLIKSKIVLDDEDINLLSNSFLLYTPSNYNLFSFWPINDFLNQIEKQIKRNTISESVIATLKNLKENISSSNNHYDEKQIVKITRKIDDILFLSTIDKNELKPILFLGKDNFANIANHQISLLPEKEKSNWYQILALSQKSTGSKPTAKFLTISKELLLQTDITNFKNTLIDWFDFIIKSKDELPEQQYYPGRFVISSPNVDMLKGLIWMCSQLNDTAIIYKLSTLTERCYRKIPNLGPASASMGNACLYSLYKSEGLEGVNQLSRLKLRIKQNNTQKIIENYLNNAAEEQGISVYEIEDLAADDFELINESRTWHFEEYKAEVSIIGVGKTTTTWKKPDGKTQKTVPSFVNEKYAENLKDLKNTKKQIELNLSSQRDRIDRMLRSDRKMTWSHFNTYFLNHGLLSFLSKNIIWNFTEKDSTFSAIFHENLWKSNTGSLVTPSTNCLISLWHPTLSSVNETSTWRNFLIKNKIQQPLKQAYREIYILTDAEVKTKSYSNRMAAHILKQHQFNSLAKTRGWKYSLLGCFDDGRDNGTAELNLKEYNLKAEFWVNEVNSDEAYNDTGIWNYIATDQVRFSNLTTNEIVDLIDVPVLVLSEILRDVDLFVGVASVGNDPTWQDTGGIPAYRDYWQSYSFGDLTETAKIRKDILTALIPRLKINKVAEIKDKFLIIKGKIRTYKIHIGSTNILMEPNDEYLCIVQDRSSKNQTENIFLPFEGDNGLSIILSKAFLLADDDKIKDSTITSQIGRT
ncbi:hypothetical protein HNP99_003168 [Flavobacterium sp. 28A]|uniref:DUF4132 domain-containing protein n=1 Tax=Flavobacterium sp. 28A TaxID=2735895 RepID=UPI0015707070|nr:DUF4132 domain-containing protein [Flavobacterium sp. 28A]NRT16795.1 hypothetical protein [Flavobacterium sp. 28A]